MKLSQRYSSLLLDSGGGWSSESDVSEPSFIAFKEPKLSLSSINNQVTIKSGSESKKVIANPLEILDKYIKQRYVAVGYIGYEYSKYTTEGFNPTQRKDGYKFPDVNFLLYKEKDVVRGNYSELIKSLQSPEITTKNANNRSDTPAPHLCPNMSISQYVEMIDTAKSYIEQGDIYQVNLSQRFNTQLLLDPMQYFFNFYQIQSVPFGAFLDFGDFQLISGSMELFLRKKRRQNCLKSDKRNHKKRNN